MTILDIRANAEPVISMHCVLQREMLFLAKTNFILAMVTKDSFKFAKT